LEPPETGDDNRNRELTALAKQCAARVAYKASPRQVQDDAGSTPTDLSDNRSDVRAIRESLLTQGLEIPSNCRARYANFVAQEHHAHHSEATDIKHTSLYTSAGLAAASAAPARAPTVGEVKARATVKELEAQLQKLKGAEQAAAAAESATLPISHSGRDIMESEGQLRKKLLGHLRSPPFIVRASDPPILECAE
jgi:hypothetical protein